MGNISSIYGYTQEKLLDYLKFFGKKILVKTIVEKNQNIFEFEKKDFEECAKLIDESIINKSFEYIEIETYKDIGGETIFIDKNMTFDKFDFILQKLKISNYEKDFKFFHDKNRLMLSFSIFSLLEDDDEIMDRLQLVLMGLRNIWVDEGRLNGITGVGMFGITI